MEDFKVSHIVVALEKISERVTSLDDRHHDYMQKNDDKHSKVLDKLDGVNGSISKIAIALEKITQLEKERQRDGERIGKISDSVNELKSDRDKALGAISSLKIFLGLLTLAVTSSFGWVYSTSTWMAKIDQWKMQVDSNIDRRIK